MGPTTEFKVHFGMGGKGRKRMRDGAEPPPQADRGTLPRLSRLMALVIRFDALVRQGAVRDYAYAARLGGVTRARMTQLMNLLHLAPDIQEDILFLPPTIRERGPLTERNIRHITATSDWRKQRRLWNDMKATASEADETRST